MRDIDGFRDEEGEELQQFVDGFVGEPGNVENVIEVAVGDEDGDDRLGAELAAALPEGLELAAALPFPDGLDATQLTAYARDCEARRVYLTAGYTSALAAAACDRIPSNEGTLECMRLVAGRVLTREIVQACDDEPSTRATLSCFAAAANAPTGPPGYEPRGGSGGPPRYERRGGYPPGPPPAPDPRGSCNQYGCARNGGGCNQYGCWHSPQGSCNQYGCRDYGACNQYGCWRPGGGCNQYGCWNSPRGACNQYGCSEYGACNQYGCPR